MTDLLETCPLDRRCNSCDETIPAETVYLSYQLGPSRYAECIDCRDFRLGPTVRPASHFDVRLLCPLSNVLEATEEIGLTLERAEAFIAEAENPRYRIVACHRPGSDPCHDVDLAYFIHQRDHERNPRAELLRYVGAPTDDLLAR